jgi:hypothetical protein
LLARQRTMAIPLFVMLMCMVPHRRILNVNETVMRGNVAEPRPDAAARA